MCGGRGPVVHELGKRHLVLGGLRSGRAEREQGLLQLGDARAGGAGNAVDGQDALVLDREPGRLRAQVGLVEHDDLRSRVRDVLIGLQGDGHDDDVAEVCGIRRRPGLRFVAQFGDENDAEAQ